MSIFRKMDRYVAWYFISSYLVCFLFFLGIFVVIDLFPKMDDILGAAPFAEDRGESLFFMTVRLYSLKIPEIFLQVAPYLTLIAAMFTVTRLRKANEMIPMVMAGVSVFRILLPLFVLAFCLMGAMVVVQEVLASPCATARLLMETFLLDHDERLIVEKEVMTGVDGRSIVVNNYDVNARLIGRVDISYFEEEEGERFNCHITGRNLRWLGEERGWSFEEGAIERERLGAGVGEEKMKAPLRVLHIGITPDDILLFLKTPYDMSLGQIKRLYAMSPTDLGLKVLLHHHITFPLTNIILLLLGLPFVLRQEQHSNFLGIAVALAICLGFFALDVIMRDMGAQDYIPPVIAAWFSVVFCGSLGICIFDSVRT